MVSLNETEFIAVVDFQTGHMSDEPSRDTRGLSDNEVLSFADGFNRDNFGKDYFNSRSIYL